VSLIVEGRLWGLISAQHRRAHPVAPRLCSQCETIGRVVSLQIGALEALDFRRRHLAKGDAIAALVASMAAADKDVLDGLANQAAALLQLTDAAGAAVVTAGRVQGVGECPPETVLRELAGWWPSARRTTASCTPTRCRSTTRPGRRTRRSSAACWRCCCPAPRRAA
jgi:light-regulated signal transduction histidine kinase (bacteriophytochrome)